MVSKSIVMRQLFFMSGAVALGVSVVGAVETLRPEQLTRGMKGYGLSVFQGTEPERFEVEILGVLPNAFPKQDMILIRMSGANLEQHKVIAGMSGSPIYVDDKLIGALAYGWPFENEPLAGVTPIHNMLAELARPAGAAGGVGPAPRGDAEKFAAPQPLVTPLSLGGFSARVLETMAPQWEQWGLWPVAAGGGARAGAAPARGQFAPGGAIGVQLIRGDLNAVAVGTVVHVAGPEVLAFGHPFFQSGRWRAPAVVAEVQTIMSSSYRSFKLATAGAPAGAMVGDWQSCIVADTTAEAPMIPVRIAAANETTDQRDIYQMEVVDNPVFSPMLVQMAILQAVTATSGSAQDTTIRVELEAQLADRSLKLANTFFNPSGGLINFEALRPVTSIFNTPFGSPAVRRLEVSIAATLTRETALIKGAYFSKSEAAPGESIPLNVVLQPFDEPETTMTVLVKVPAAPEAMRMLSLFVVAGGLAPPDVAPPDSLTTFLNNLEKRHRHTDLVVLVQSPGQGLQYRGRLLKNLPASVISVLDNTTIRDIVTVADVQQIIVPTKWVLSGFAAARIPIREQ